jgi:hypothetical protein
MTTPPRTQGFKAILIADSAYTGLKAIQSWQLAQSMGLPVRFDLKDIATAFVEEALTDPSFPERVLRRAVANLAPTLSVSSSSLVSTAAPTGTSPTPRE